MLWRILIILHIIHILTKVLWPVFKESERMRFVQKWSYACAKQLAAGLNENHQKRAVYYYGFYIIIGALVKGFFLLSAASVFRVLIPTIVVTFTFASLRVFAGGYHMTTYGRCLFASMGLFIASALIAKHTHEFWSIHMIAVLIAMIFIIGCFILLKYAPKDTPNKPITEPEKIKMYKTLSLTYLFVWGILSALLLYFNYKMVILCMSFAIILELFSVTPIGCKTFSLIDGK